jgi:hypothetical protein
MEETEDHHSAPETDHWDEPAAPPTPVNAPVEDEAEEAFEDDDMS